MRRRLGETVQRFGRGLGRGELADDLGSELSKMRRVDFLKRLRVFQKVTRLVGTGVDSGFQVLALRRPVTADVGVLREQDMRSREPWIDCQRLLEEDIGRIRLVREETKRPLVRRTLRVLLGPALVQLLEPRNRGRSARRRFLALGALDETLVCFDEIGISFDGFAERGGGAGVFAGFGLRFAFRKEGPRCGRSAAFAGGG